MKPFRAARERPGFIILRQPLASANGRRRYLLSFAVTMQTDWIRKCGAVCAPLNVFQVVRFHADRRRLTDKIKTQKHLHLASAMLDQAFHAA